MDQLLGQCEEALKRHNAGAAETPLAEAVRRSADGGGDALRPRFDRCRTDLDMLKELDRIEELYWTVAGDTFQSRAADREWLAAFRAFGMDPDATPVPDAVQRVAESLIRERLIGGLDRWLMMARLHWVVEVLAGADPHPVRNPLRHALRDRDWDKYRALADKPEALDQPARFALVLGKHPALDHERRVAILRAAAIRSPDDPHLPMQLAILHAGPNSNPAEREKWTRAALAVRQTAAAWNNLGTALAQQQRYAEAAPCLRKAVELNPRYGIAHSNLGNVLLQLGEPDAAVAAHRRAVELNPTLPAGRNNLGIALVQVGNRREAEQAYLSAIRLKPEFPEPHFNLGKLFLKEADGPRAAVWFRRAVALGLNDPDTRLGLEQALELQGMRPAQLPPLEVAPPPHEK
jgi:Flp pilus assembly protein TadD